MQTLISVIGLAVGFTCFTLSALWVKYEMSYDSFHKNAKQMYVVYAPSLMNPGEYDRRTSYTLVSYLKKTFPEVANAAHILPASRGDKAAVNGVEFPALFIRADSSFLKMFEIKIMAGSRDFLIPGSQKIAITQEKAVQLFGSENPIGKTINGNTEICAVISGITKHTNFPFDFIGAFEKVVVENNWLFSTGATIIEMFPDTNIKNFEKKLNEQEIVKDKFYMNHLKIIPLTKLRNMGADIESEVKFQYILIFALSGLLVITCSLFNYLTLFVSRFRIRQRELALRVVCGASGGSLFTMLSVEFMLTLLFAVLLGGMFTQWLHRTFLALSEIQMDLPAIYYESLLYIGVVILISLLIFWLILFIFRRRNLNLSIRKSNNNLSRKVSIIVQLIISISFAFCTIVILKQMYFLHHTTELGFSFQNRGSVALENRIADGFVNRLKQIPEITETVHVPTWLTLIPQSVRGWGDIVSWDDKPVDATRIHFENFRLSSEVAAFYELQLITGEMMTDADSETMVLINESAVKAFGWINPIGKQFEQFNVKYTVKGVIKNIYNFAPTIRTDPYYYLNYKSSGISSSTNVLFKYRDGMWKSCKEKIERLIEKEYANANHTIYNAEEEYNKYLKSENALIKLLSFVSAICVFICVFGFVSMVSLTCEERRKAVAIRKINGATVGDILSIFAKEYFLLLIIGAAIAFPVGYFIMKRWLEQYVKQTSIPAWIYLSILFVLALIIVLSVGWQVYKTSVENPAEVVKKE